MRYGLITAALINKRKSIETTDSHEQGRRQGVGRDRTRVDSTRGDDYSGGRAEGSNDMIAWVVGQVRGKTANGDAAWDFQGLFATEELAVAACRDHNYFVAPAEMNTPLQHEKAPSWPGAYYPLAARK